MFDLPKIPVPANKVLALHLMSPVKASKSCASQRCEATPHALSALALLMIFRPHKMVGLVQDVSELRQQMSAKDLFVWMRSRSPLV